MGIERMIMTEEANQRHLESKNKVEEIRKVKWPSCSRSCCSRGLTSALVVHHLVCLVSTLCFRATLGCPCPCRTLGNRHQASFVADDHRMQHSPLSNLVSFSSDEFQENMCPPSGMVLLSGRAGSGVAGPGTATDQLLRELSQHVARQTE